MRYFKENDAVFQSQSSFVKADVFSPLDSVMMAQREILKGNWSDSDPLKAVAVAQIASKYGLVNDPVYVGVKAFEDFQKSGGLAMKRNEFVRDTSSWKGGSEVS